MNISKDALIIILYYIPYIIIVIALLIGIGQYIIKNGLNARTIAIIANTLKNDEQFKSVVEEAIVVASKTTSWDDIDDGISSVKKYLYTYIYSSMQLVDSIIETAPKDESIVSVLKENNIDIKNIEKVVDEILNSLGYNDDSIGFLLLAELKKKE